MKRFYRPQRGSLERSMAEVAVVTSMAELRVVLEVLAIDVVEVKPYGFDARIDWDTHIVTVNGEAVGFTNGPL